MNIHNPGEPVISGTLLKHRFLNKWPLFWLVTTVVSVIVLGNWWTADTSTAPGVSLMIQRSVRCAVPLLYLTFAASSMAYLFKTGWSRWILRNRKFFGLGFAAAMAWQLFFILWLVTLHRDYYVQEVYVLRDVIEGVAGYGLLAAMTFTSFEFGRRPLTPGQWKTLHKLGIYSLWIYAYSVYWWEVHYYGDPNPIDFVYYVAGFLAWGLRIMAWGKKRHIGVQPAGLFVSTTGLLAWLATPLWALPAEQMLNGHAATGWAETYLPYWPFEPFFPIFIILAGAMISARLSSAKARALA